MLNAIRVASSKWLGRLVLTVIMGFLIISFAIWGIGDIFRGGINRTVASVGAVKISAEEFRASFNTELRRIQQQSRRAITTEDARAFGLDRLLLNRAIDEAVLNQKVRELGLAVDQAVVVRSITEAPEFRVAGQFDRNRLAEALQQAGLSEQAFLKQQAERVVRLQLVSGLVGGLGGSESLQRAVHQFREEARALDVVVVPADKVATPAEPDAAALTAYFEERKAEFRTPEIRKATLIVLSPGDFAAGISVSEAELKAFYDRLAVTGRFGNPERRQAQRVLFDTEAEAGAAAEKLAAGGTFEVLLAERKLSESDVDLGLKAAGEIGDAALSAAIFRLEAGKISAPVKDPFGFALVRVTKIEPAKLIPFDAVRGQIEGEARADKLTRDPGLRGKLDGVTKKIEEQRLAGKSLAEAATAAGVPTVVIAALDRQGEDGAGTRLTVPGGMDIVNAIFASDIGLDNEPLPQRDGGAIWLEVNGVEPAREKTFDEVKTEVRSRLIAELRDKALAEKMTGFVRKIEEGTALSIVASELGLTVQRIADVKRGGRDAVLGQAGVERAFAGPVGKPVTALAADGTSRVLILPTAATLPPFDAALDAKSGLPAQIAQGFAEDIMAQYTAGLKKQLGVKIDQAILNQALGQNN
jgi:peptidyl-prolyl cis-trans isomerase D